jgi:hypothetical protein
MQHIQLKIFANPGDPIHFQDAIPVFHRWIQNRLMPELLIDVVDYAHVPAGPGVILIGHEASYSLNNAGGRPGLLYSRHAGDDFSLQQAYAAALSATTQLAQEPEFAGKLTFNPHHFQIILNDRLLYPNNEETWQRVEPDLKVLLDAVFGPKPYSITRPSDPRLRLSAEVA